MLDKQDLIKLSFRHFKLPDRIKLVDIVKNTILLDSILSINRSIGVIYRFQGHEEKITCVASLYEGDIVTGSENGTIGIHNKKNGFNCEQILTGHQGSIRSLCALPTGDIASGGDDNQIKIWGREGGYKCIHTMSLWGPAICLVVLPDGNLAAGGGRDDNIIRIYEVDNGFRCLTRLSDFKFQNCFITNSLGNIVSAAVDRTIRVYNYQYRCSHTLQGHVAEVNSLVLLPSGNIASSSGDGMIIIWNYYNNYQVLKKFLGDEIMGVSLALVSKSILISSSCNQFKLWDICSDPKLIQENSYYVGRLTAVYDDEVATISECGVIKIWGL
jgi:WD40 repeat protein